MSTPRTAAPASWIDAPLLKAFLARGQSRAGRNEVYNWAVLPMAIPVQNDDLASVSTEEPLSGASASRMNAVLFLLGLSVLINYIDRSNLSIAAPLLKDELGISASQLGTLLSAFFWTYALMQIPAGWLVDRFDVRGCLPRGSLCGRLRRRSRGFCMGSQPC
jgi:hypothetical protein